MKDVFSYSIEAFNIIKDKFILIDTLPDDCEIVRIYGDLCVSKERKNICYYIRNLFNDKINNDIIPKKHIYIYQEKEHFKINIIKMN